jgi:hypothetical protein
VQRADLHGRAQDVLKRRLNVTLPELEMPEVLFFLVAISKTQKRSNAYTRPHTSHLTPMATRA